MSVWDDESLVSDSDGASAAAVSVLTCSFPRPKSGLVVVVASGVLVPVDLEVLDFEAVLEPAELVDVDSTLVSVELPARALFAKPVLVRSLQDADRLDIPIRLLSLSNTA